MKKGLIALFFVLSFGLNAQVDSVWQAYQDSTDASWGVDWEKTEHYLINAKEHLEYKLANPHLDTNYNLTLSYLGAYYYKVSQYGEAVSAYRELLENTEEALGRDHRDYGAHLGKLADVYLAMGKFQRAESAYKEVIQNTEVNLGRDHSDYWIYVGNLGNLYRTMERYEEAIPLMEEALENSIANLGRDHLDCGAQMNNLALLYKDKGLYQEVFPLYKEALKIITDSLGLDHAYHGIMLSNLASMYQNIGRYEEALPLYLKAIENTASSLGRNHANYSIILNNVGELYLSMNRIDDAESQFKQALEEVGIGLGRNHWVYGLIQSNLGKLYRHIGNYKEALGISKEAVENATSSLGKHHSTYGNRLNNLALIHQSMGNYEEALSLYSDALENTKISLGPQHLEYGIRLNNLGFLYKEMERYTEAVGLCSRGNNNLIIQVRKIFVISSEKHKQDFLKTIQSNFHQYQSFAYISNYQFDSLNFMLYNNSLWQKGLVLNSTTQTLSTIQQSGDSSHIEKFENWKNLRNQIARQFSKPIAKRISGLDSLERVANQWEEDLVRGSSEFATSQKEVQWDEVRNQLSDGEAAIEFVHFRYHDRVATDSILYAAMILIPNCSRPEIIPLFEEKQFTKVLQSDISSGDILAINDLYRGAQPLKTRGAETYHDLYKLIWQPLEEELEGIHTIYYVPSGQLHQVAMSAIAHPDGGNLSDHYDLIQLASTRNLVNGSEAPGNESLALFGGIEYDYEVEVADADSQHVEESMLAVVTQSDQRSALLNKFNYLEGTDSEVNEIRELFNRNETVTTLHTGQTATESSFKSLSGNSPDVIHIATHGFFFPDVEYTAEEIERGAAFKYIDNPMFRAGLAFAGANYTWEHGINPFEEEDGILTAYEISNMDLTNTDLVVLSACETGLGEIKGSEGVFGLQRAFKMAGVDYLMMSLWQVPDKETSEFMVLFYDNWLGGKPIRVAFQETQSAMSDRYPEEPYKWAAFVLVE